MPVSVNKVKYLKGKGGGKTPAPRSPLYCPSLIVIRYCTNHIRSHEMVGLELFSKAKHGYSDYDGFPFMFTHFQILLPF